MIADKIMRKRQTSSRWARTAAKTARNMSVVNTPVFVL
jgi:hypothetical protein